jgi:hypothetical protein
VQDPDWGPAFLTLGTYRPYPIKVCLNGHAWVKQQLRRAGVVFDSLDNGFLACADPIHLQAIGDRLGPADVQAFFDRWAARLPSPLTARDRAAGSSHVMQYFKEQRALRTETTINNPKDFYVAKAVSHVSHLRDLGDQVNRKLLEVERVSHQCVLTQGALDRLQHPTIEAGQRASALRFADPRVMALCHAITGFAHLPRGFHNRDLRYPHRSPPRAPVLGGSDDVRSAAAAPPGPDTSHSQDAPVHRHDLRSDGRLLLRLLLREALSPHPATRVGGPAAGQRRAAPPLRAALDRLDAKIQHLHKEADLAA